MKKLRTASVVLAIGAVAVLVVGSVAGAAVSKKPKKTIVAFTASYSGNATVNVVDNVANISASGTGTALRLGAGKITGTGKGDSSQRPCVPFTGPGSMVGAKGSISFAVISGSQGCGDEEGQVFALSGKAKVTKATGALAKATGTLKFSGTYDRGAGTFTVKFKGSLVK
jgi:hypothetical protein